ncbi:MAG TPA: tetratricopeptide repeat protein [Nitrospirales bacterium]|jgi:Tfp pilus assembly protein PilF
MISTKTSLVLLLATSVASISLSHAAGLGAETPISGTLLNEAPPAEAVLPEVKTDPLAELREAIRLNPNHADAHFTLGVELYTSGDVAGGIVELREAVRLKPHHADARYHLAKALLIQRDALTLTEKNRGAGSGEPVLAEAYVELGKSLIAAGNFTEAVMELREAIRLEPSFVEAHASLAFALFNMGDIDSAIEEYQTALRLQPETGQARLNLATALMAKHDWAAARTQLQEALRLQPDLIQAQYNLGVVAYTMGDVAGAIAAYRKALRIDAAYAEAHYNLGLMLKLTKQETEAVQEFHAAALAGLPKAQYFLGAAYASGLGVEKNLPAAIKFWSLAAEQGMHQAREELAQLRRTALLPARQSVGDSRVLLTAFQDFRSKIWDEFPELQGKAAGGSAGVALLQQGEWQEAIPVLIREGYALSEPAQSQLQTLYEEGIKGQMAPYDPRIFAYFKTTAAEGLPRPRVMLARIYAKGWGVPQDFDKAAGLLKGSEDEESIRLLQEIPTLRQEAQHAATKSHPPSSTTP